MKRIILILAVFLFGCGIIETGTEVAGFGNLLDVEFERPQQDEEIVPFQQRMIVDLFLKNNGERDIEELYACIDGFTNIGGDECICETNKGTKLRINDGEEIKLSYDVHTSEIKEEWPVFARAITRYKYRTDTNVRVCIPGTSLETGDCAEGSSIVRQDKNAQIKVKGIEQEERRNGDNVDVILTLEMDQSGDGLPTGNLKADCDLRVKEQRRINVAVNPNIGSRAVCKAVELGLRKDDTEEWLNGEKKTQCVLEGIKMEGSYYMQPLTISMIYNFEQVEGLRFKVKNE